MAIAMINTAGYAAGSLPGSFIFPSNFGPSYRNSFVVTILAFSATICLVLLTRRHLAHLNVELSTVSTPIELSAPVTPRTTQSRLEAAATVNSALASLASRQQLCVRSRVLTLTTQSLPVHPLNPLAAVQIAARDVSKRASRRIRTRSSTERHGVIEGCRNLQRADGSGSAATRRRTCG